MNDYEWEKAYEWDGISETVLCGSCEGYHRPEYTGDCRNDMERITDWNSIGDPEVRTQLDDIYIKHLQELLNESCTYINDHRPCDCNRCDFIRRVNEYQSIVNRRWV